MTDLPVVCSLSPEARAARREGLLSQLAARVEAQDELTDGYRLRFAASADVLQLIARAVEAERQCCQFLRFTLTVEPAGGPMVLDLTGPPGTREFLAALFNSTT